MARAIALVLAVVSAALLGAALLAPARAAGVERLYVLYCGETTGSDQARWSPGVNVGVRIQLANSCFLIRHARGLFLWDTGHPDAIAQQPDGVVGGGGTTVARRTRTLASQLAAIGVDPAAVKVVAVSHTHGDHVGNVGLFANATVLMQGAEVDHAYPGGSKSPILPSQTLERLAGDRDVFGDGSVLVVSTPGHTPGHQSLLVQLPKTGAVLLTGDAVHFRDNWENRRVPSMNTSREQTLASMQRIEQLVRERKGQLWINHDRENTAKLRHAPEFYE